MSKGSTRYLHALSQGGARPGFFTLKGRHSSEPAAHPGAAAIGAARQGAVAALGSLPFARLSAEERQRLGARLFQAAGALVDQVARGLAAQPARYADLDGRAVRLRERQAEADAWLQLRGALGHLHALASDSYLLAQAEVLGEAEALLAQVRAEGAGPEAAARVAGLLPALEVARAVGGRRRALRPLGPTSTGAAGLLRSFREALGHR